jgi:hypothetical protein
MGERERKLGENENLFRGVNERLKELGEAFEGMTETAEFVCECADRSCAERIRMTLDEYERVRAAPTHFLIVPGHEAQLLERVVDENERYLIVEKRPGDPAKAAIEGDPRA